MGIGEVTKAVFLDRDGVLNRVCRARRHAASARRTWTNWKSTPMRPRRCAASKQAGYLLIVVTNQPDVARGTQTRAAVDEINAAHRRGAADRRISWFARTTMPPIALAASPSPGWCWRRRARHAVDLRQSFLIGDRWRDIDCGASAGVRTVLIDRGVTERTPDHAPDFMAESLAAAADWILGKARRTVSFSGVNRRARRS